MFLFVWLQNSCILQEPTIYITFFFCVGVSLLFIKIIHMIGNMSFVEGFVKGIIIENLCS
jgi:hypothetical protein